MRYLRHIGLLLCVLGPTLAGQTPADTGAARTRSPRAEGRGRWQAHLREALNLTDDQAAKLAATARRFGAQRRTLWEQQRALTQALHHELQPGVAADVDSLRKLLDARERGENALTDLRRDERREIASYLSPLQRARLVLLRERFARRGHRGGRGRHGPGRGWGKGGVGKG